MSHAFPLHSRPRPTTRSALAHLARDWARRACIDLGLLPMNSRRCSPCRKRWPLGWSACPQCGKNTEAIHLNPTHTDEDARAAIEERFEEFLVAREERRIGEGPEGIGIREARELIDLERRLA